MKNPFDNISIIIPVREGSSRIESKVFLPFYKELNLIEWKISQLIQFQQKDRIILSSNSEKIKKIAYNMGVEYHDRGDYLCVGHQASFSEVITGIVKDIATEHFAWVTVVVPLMSPEEYIDAFRQYQTHVVDTRNHDSLFSANLIKEYLWNELGPINYEANRNHTISQNLPNIFKVTNGLYMRDKKNTLKDGYFLGKNPKIHLVSKMAGIDIDEWDDYEFSKAMLSFYSHR